MLISELRVCALLSFLNRAGVISYFDNLFSNVIILQTEWVLDAMYEALRLTDNPLKYKYGKLNNEDFELIWKDYNDYEKTIFKNYMLKSEILAEPKNTFQNRNLERSYRFLMPSLFPVCPNHLKFQWDDKREYWVIKFRFMYTAIIQRLQVKVLNYCHYQEEESLFKNYLAFTGKQNEICNIEVIEDSKEMRIWSNTAKYYEEIINLINEIYPLERLQIFERKSQQVKFRRGTARRHTAPGCRDHDILCHYCSDHLRRAAPHGRGLDRPAGGLWCGGSGHWSGT